MAKVIKKIYLNPDGNPISKKDYLTLKSARPDAWLIRQYENDKFRLTLSAISEPITSGVPKQYWKRFRVTVQNIVTTDYNGNPVDKHYVTDPDASKDYLAKDFAMRDFDAFLLAYTTSFMEGDVVVEVDNKFSKDLPLADERVDTSIIGSW